MEPYSLGPESSATPKETGEENCID